MNNQYDDDLLNESTQHLSPEELDEILLDQTTLTEPTVATGNGNDEGTVFLGPGSGSAEDAISYSLVLIQGDEQFGPETTIRAGESKMGRAKECDIVVDDHRASRVHAMLIADNAGCVIKDLGSSNGVQVDDTIIDGSCKLSNGNRIRIGDAVYLFMDNQDAICSRQELLAGQEGPEPQEGKPMGMIVLAGALVVGAVALYFFL